MQNGEDSMPNETTSFTPVEASKDIVTLWRPVGPRELTRLRGFACFSAPGSLQIKWLGQKVFTTEAGLVDVGRGSAFSSANPRTRAKTNPTGRHASLPATAPWSANLLSGPFGGLCCEDCSRLERPSQWRRLCHSFPGAAQLFGQLQYPTSWRRGGRSGGTVNPAMGFKGPSSRLAGAIGGAVHQ